MRACVRACVRASERACVRVVWGQEGGNSFLEGLRFMDPVS